MIRAFGRLAAVLALARALTAAAVAGFAALHPRLAAPPGPAPLAIVLGGGMRSPTALGPQSQARLETGLALWEAGRVARLHFSGGGPRLPEASEAGLMAAIAEARGLPEDAFTAETRSRSTLQNARFTIAAIGVPPPGTLLVTHAYHLPRAWLAFRWSGARGLVLVSAGGFADLSPADRARAIARETLAWWFNLARMAGVALLEAIGLPPERTEPLLAQAR